MKYYYSLFFIFAFFNLNAQLNTISIEYKVIVNDEEKLFDNNSALKQLLKNAITNSGKLSFLLLAKNGNSKFVNKSILNLEDGNGSNNAIFPFIGYAGNVYTFKDSVLVQSSILGGKIYVRKNNISNWKITNETKMIDKHLCYKATNLYTVISPDKEFNHPVTAWFCPNLPYPFGPNGYGNLPGLILELQVRNSVFGVSKINLETKDDFDISEIKNIKIITEIQLEKLLLKKMEEE